MSYRLMADGIGGSFTDPQAIRDRFGPGVYAAGYIDGAFAWSADQWDLFDPARRIRISVTGEGDWDAVDCETGDLTAAQAAAAVRRRRSEGYDRPTVYCGRAVIPEVRFATGDLVLGRDYDLWAADWTGQPHRVDAGGGLVCAVTQYVSDPAFDLSAIYDPGWPHRTDAPPPPPPHDNWTERMMDNLPTVDENGCPAYLGYRVQGLVAAVGRLRGLGSVTAVTFDGSFGPKTTAGVKAVQKSYKLTEDGVVGPDTWAALVTS